MEQNFLPPLCGPSWMYNKSSDYIQAANWNTGYNRFPDNDGLSVLPVLEDVNYPVTYNTKDGGMKSYLRFQPKKFIDKEFPFKTCIPCILPFDTEENELPFSNYDSETFCDNQVDSFSDGVSQYLVFIEKKNDMNQIIMSKIISDKKNSVKYSLKDNKVIAQHQKVCQLCVKHICHEGNVLIRSPDKISLYITNLNSKNSLLLSNAKYASLHPSLKGHISVIDSCSAVNFYNIENCKPLWNGTIEDQMSHDKNNSIFECHFANHPSQLYVVGNHDVCLADMRISSNKIKNIFNVGSMKNIIHYKVEEILSLKQVTDLPYFYTICHQSVVLMDSRYCKEPVITWLHMMKCKPKFCQYYDEDDNIKGLILADSLQGSVTVIPAIYSNSDGDIPSASALSAPKQFNILKDTLAFAHLNNRWHSQNVLQSIKLPLVGMTILSLHKKSEALLCFQNKAGLLFYQAIVVTETVPNVSAEISDDFAESHSKFVILSTMKKYEKKIRFSQQHHNLTMVIEGIPTEKMKSKNHFKRTIYFGKDSFSVWNIKKANSLANRNIQDKWKNVLKYEIDTFSLEKNEVSSEIKCLHKKYANINANKLTSYSDSLSKKLINPWIKFDKDSKATIHEEKYGYSFKRHPPKTGKSKLFTFSLPNVDLTLQESIDVKLEVPDLESQETHNGEDSLASILSCNKTNVCNTNKNTTKRPRRSAVQGF